MSSSGPAYLYNNGCYEKHLDSAFKENKPLVLLLDYDGTLAPIVPHPDLAVMEPKSEEALRSLAMHPDVFVAIISGRSVDSVREKVNIENITYAGNHGYEIFYPNETYYYHPIPEDVQKKFRKMAADLKDNLAHSGAWVENKKQSLTFHYRDVESSVQNEFREEAKCMIEMYGFKASYAHCAVEAKPPVEWNKGEAALHILRSEFGDDWYKKATVMFMGDDTTDEDAMKAIKNRGISFRITTNPDIVTFADYRLETTKDVANLLDWLLMKVTIRN